MNNIKFKRFRKTIYAIYLLGSMFLFQALFIALWSYFKRGNPKSDLIFVLFSNILTLVLILFLTRKVLYRDLVDFKNNFLRYLKIILLSYVAIFISNMILGGLIEQFTSIATTENQVTIEALGRGNLREMFFISVIYAPIIEEIIFRGTIINFSENKRMATLFLSSFIFGFLHVFASLITRNYMDLVNIFIYVSMGLIIGYSYLKTENIWVAISIHTLNNFIGYMIMFSGMS